MKVDMNHLMALARLRFDPGELEGYRQDIERMVNMVSNLPDIEGGTSLLDPQNPMALRADVVTPSLPQSDIIACAPAKQAGCIVVPRTVE